jgi:cation transport protein ChaC
MTQTQDPFSHHPELRNLIADPETSPMRQITTAMVLEQIRSVGGATDWLHSDAVREGLRHSTLNGRAPEDLWVFGYGSLMWDPAIRFAEVRRARLPNYARRFILRDTNGGRGTRDAPGVMAALDACPPDQPGCEGLVFRIPAPLVEAETRILWQREIIGAAYLATFADAKLGDDTITVLTFVADHSAEPIVPDLSHADQVQCLAKGQGFLGSSLQYLTKLDAQFKALGVTDPDVASLLAETQAYIRDNQL